MRRMVQCAAAGLVAAAIAAPVLGQEPELSRRDLSLAAGYVAAFTCSAHFNAGRSVDDIRAGELARIYPDYRGALETLPEPVIDEHARTVSVVFADDMAPRTAMWHAYLGCVQLPPGSAPEHMADRIPHAQFDRPNFDASQIPWPDGDLTAERPALANAVVSALADIVEASFDEQTYGEGTRTTGVVVVHGGNIVSERYADDFDMHTPQRTWSVAKSIAATVIGAAVYEGMLFLDAPLPLDDWSQPGDPRARITLRNVLNMSSGLNSGPTGSRTDEIYFGGGLVADHAVRAELEAPPGARWRYANNDTLIAMRALRQQFESDAAYHAFPFERVLDRIGMAHTTLETDWGGDFVMSSQVWTTARDLARLGLLYLNDGEWNGQRVLPEGWANTVATPAPSQPPEGYPGYGAQFWLFGPAHGLPEGTYAAQGHRGQYVFIVPSRNVVVVRRGFDESGGQRFAVAQFVRDILAVLPE